jgi:CBS domain-containing protein
MTTEVVSVRPTAPLKDVAEAFAARGISGIPVVDVEGCVVGVVSEADILFKERGPARRHLFDRKAEVDRLKVDARTVAEAMSAPPITVEGHQRVGDAARLMLDHRIKRLPVVDEDGFLVGIVTRTDLVRAFVRPDEEIKREIREEVLLEDLWLDPLAFDIEVERGEVRIVGKVGSSEERSTLERRVALVPGVVAVDLRVVAVNVDD